jgi:putative ABC transport system ATP-binding protein
VPYLTALENLLVIADARMPGIERRAAELLDELGVAERSNMVASRLSGGERQRVALGRALINQPDLLLVDEPTSALDSDRGRQVMDLLRDEVRHHATAAVVVTHDPRMVGVCDRMVELRDGRIGQSTSPLVG